MSSHADGGRNGSVSVIVQTKAFGLLMRDHEDVEHRQFLAHPEARRRFVGSDVFLRVGGAATINALIDGLYERIEADAALRPLFGRDLKNGHEGQKRFFTEWLGGDRGYSENAYHSLKQRHDLLPITREIAEKWLAHFRSSIDVAVIDAETRRMIYDDVHLIAMALVNEEEPPSALRARSHGVCLRYKPAIDSLGLARQGDAARLGALLKHAPDILASAPHAAALLHLAALAGRTTVVELLLGSGVDVNKPSPIALTARLGGASTLIFVTPLCAARAKRRKEVEALLVRRSAKEDIFTHAFLGDLERLREDLERNPSSAQTIDPAVDALEITPIHHAVAGARVEALRMLLSHLSHANEPLLGGARAVRAAAGHDNVAMVAMLLQHGADAIRIGAGRWVLHPELAPMLTRAGACVDRSGSWIGASCTGNQGRKDDPEFVAALLRHGARANDRRLIGQDHDGGQATALHYAAKAGFVKTIAVLLEHGADPNAEDDNGLTPLNWLEQAAKSVDRDAVHRLLRRPNLR
jgi:truncated hemoglobin YjbI/ankyrin repeat protein